MYTGEVEKKSHFAIILLAHGGGGYGPVLNNNTKRVQFSQMQPNLEDKKIKHLSK